jgi:hypothetical protein
MASCDLGAPRPIPPAISLASAEQPEDLYRIRRREDIGVTSDDQRRRLDASDEIDLAHSEHSAARKRH